MRKRIILLSIFVMLFAAAMASQDLPHIEKGQFLPAPQIVRSQWLKTTRDATTIYEENFETGATDWSFNESWGIGVPLSGPESAYDSENCAGTNLDGEYSNYADDWLISPEISLEAADEIKLYFMEWFSLESGYDYGKVKISTDGGMNWTQIATSNGYSEWRETEVDLTSYANETIHIAFHLTSDGSVTSYGWYIDNVRIDLMEPDLLSARMLSLSAQNFPFIFMNVAVDSMGVGTPYLTEDNFTVYENGVMQPDYFEVIPPDIGGGSRIADIVFVLDVTGSMSEEIAAVKANMVSFINGLEESNIDYHIGFVVYGDLVYVYNNYQLYSDYDTIISLTNNISLGENGIGSGGDWPENQIGAMAEAALMNFRPGAQKIQIMLTDAPSHEGNSVTPWTVETLLSDRLLPNNIVVFPIFDNEQSPQNEQYIPIAEATNPASGTYYHIYDNFDDIILEIGSMIGSTYLVRYRSNNPTFDGVLRNVEVQVSYFGEQATATGSYMPGATPVIERTQETIDLHAQAWAENTEFTIEVEISDEYEPFTQSATLYYKNTTESSYYSVMMYPAGKGDIWSVTIPGYDVITPGLDYYITATDGQSTASSPSVQPSVNPYQIAILPNEAPDITHTPVSISEQNVDIDISATVSDNTNELDTVTLHYRQTGDLTYQVENMENTSGDNFVAAIPSEFVTGDGVDYFIKASDNFGVFSYHGTPDKPHEIFTAVMEIWPGDTNMDGVVNAIDILYIGAYWKTSGPSRNAVSYQWQAFDYPLDWPNAYAPFADCNGDGIIDNGDILAIGFNWSKTHSSTLQNIPINTELIYENEENFREIYQNLGNAEYEQDIKQYLKLYFEFEEEEQPSDIPIANKLYGNFPNPFNPTTEISYSLRNNAYVQINVYNLKGQLIVTLVDEFMEKGLHKTVWKGKNAENRQVSSGIYFYDIKTEEFSDVKKMLLLK